MRDVLLLVTGSRSWPPGSPVMLRVLWEWGCRWNTDGFRATLMHGACKDGADAFAEALWSGWRWPTEPVPAKWDECGPECIGLPQPHRRRNRRGEWYCPGAGMRRNAVMVGRGPAMVLAFVAGSPATSPGTHGCMRLARAARIPVWEYWPDGRVVDPFPKRGLPGGALW